MRLSNNFPSHYNNPFIALSQHLCRGSTAMLLSHPDAALNKGWVFRGNTSYLSENKEQSNDPDKKTCEPTAQNHCTVETCSSAASAPRTATGQRQGPVEAY